MRQVSLLDCTLRDGGYLNNWNFGKGTIDAIIQRLSYANVDLIEVGFVDDRVEENTNYSIQPFVKSYNSIIKKVNEKTKYLVMIDYGTCSIDNVQPKDETIIDGIRLIFKKEKVTDALRYAIQLKEKGYLIFLQMVSITDYSKDDIEDFCKIVNKLHPYAVSIVDTYGLMHKDQTFSYYGYLDDNLSKSIQIGFHSHNNFQLAYSNSIELISKKSKRKIIVDGTLYGMGKSAGNAPIELIAMYLNDNCNGRYDISQLLEAIDNNIMSIHKELQWGYSMTYFLSASNDCHPDYIQFLLKKRTLSIKSINEIVSLINKQYKLRYDKSYISQLYEKYQSCFADDTESIQELKQMLSGKKLLILGPGRSVVDESDVIIRCIKEEHPIIIDANCVVNKYPINLIIFSNSKRYNMVHEDCESYVDKLVLTSNITPIGRPPRFLLDYKKFITTPSGNQSETILAVLLNLTKNVESSEIYFAGFDGFGAVMNYYSDYLNLGSIDNYSEINTKMMDLLKQYDRTKYRFITNSLFNQDI